jgi:hypothetical protein
MLRGIFFWGILLLGTHIMQNRHFVPMADSLSVISPLRLMGGVRRIHRKQRLPNPNRTEVSVNQAEPDEYI